MCSEMQDALPYVFTAAEAQLWLAPRYKAPLKALAKMEKSGELIRLKRGFYSFRKGFDPILAAQLLHGPSYISYETALAYYGLIPEVVESILSVVDGRPVEISTPAADKHQDLAEWSSELFIAVTQEIKAY